jgi:hypothetical protein
MRLFATLALHNGFYKDTPFWTNIEERKDIYLFRGDIFGPAAVPKFRKT